MAAAPTRGRPITFRPGNVVRARPDVVLDGAGTFEARVLLWDDLTLDQRAAEMIALPIVEYVDDEFGAGSAGLVRVWQLQTGQQAMANPASARAREAEVEAVLAAL